jgi:hypothetical protein
MVSLSSVIEDIKSQRHNAHDVHATLVTWAGKT